MRLFDYPMAVVLLFQGITASKIKGAKSNSSRSLALMSRSTNCRDLCAKKRIKNGKMCPDRDIDECMESYEEEQYGPDGGRAQVPCKLVYNYAKTPTCISSGQTGDECSMTLYNLLNYCLLLNSNPTLEPHPCRQNSAIYSDQAWWRSPDQHLIVGNMEEMLVHDNAHVCADLCGDSGEAYFGYFRSKDKGRCKCVKRLPWGDGGGRTEDRGLEYWEGGVTGQVTCFAAPPGSTLEPDPPVRPPWINPHHNTPMYKCFTSKGWPGCWKGGRMGRAWTGGMMGQGWTEDRMGKPLCYNSFTMSWEGFIFCEKKGFTNGQEFCEDITFDWCFSICKYQEECIGIKWRKKNNRCWLHTSAFYVEGAFAEASCKNRAVFKKAGTIIVPESIPELYDRTCPCGHSMCGEMNLCFQAELNSANGARKQHCRDVQVYKGNLSSLQNARTQCDLTLRRCQQVSPICFLNLSLAWEQGLLNLHDGAISLVAIGEQKRLNDDVTQGLLQRSGRGLEEGDDKFNDVDVDASGDISIAEFRIFLQSKGYQLMESTVTEHFESYDEDRDGVLNKSEWNGLVLPTFCPCMNEIASGVSLIQGSSMENLGLEDDLDYVYERKGGCR